MPRIFSEEDRNAIRRALIEAGRVRFERYGLRKTNVEELARDVGIAKGTFYHFFGSKEELCLAIFHVQESSMREDIAQIMAGCADPVETVSRLMLRSLQFVKEDSLISRLRENGEYSLLTRGMEGEDMARHLEEDKVFIEQVLENLKAKGAKPVLDIDVLAGVFRSLIMLAFHEKEIGSEVYGATTEAIVQWFAWGITGLIPAKKPTGDGGR